MSKRGQATGGAFDALVHAIVGLGAVRSWAKLPPPTAPGSLARALGQGVLHGRLPRGGQRAGSVEAAPLPVQSMQHEGQRSVAELGAILWHAMGGARDAPELGPWMAPPHADAIVALSLSRTAPDGERSVAGVAVLRYPVHVDDPASPESQAGTKLVIDTLAAPDAGSVARAKTAIALHLANDGQAARLRSYRASTVGTGSPREVALERRGSFTALFALKRAPEPERGEDRAAGPGSHRRGGAGPLLARQEVGPHWKRQAYGPRHSRRRWIVIERYERGPEPQDDQIVVTRLADRQHPAPNSTGERR